MMYDDGQHDAHNKERRVMEDRVTQDLLKRGVAHHVLAENTNDALAQKYRSVERTSADSVDDEEPDCDCGCTDEAGDHAFTQKVVRPLSHWRLWSGSISFPAEKIRNHGVYSKRARVQTECQKVQQLMMFSRRIRIAILVALAACAATPPILEAQTRKKQTTTRRRVRRPSRNRPPPMPIVRYSSPRSSGDLASTLAGLTGHTRSGAWGAMVTSL